LVRKDSHRWIVDFGVGTASEDAALYESPFAHVVECVKPEREKNNDKWRRNHWWVLGRTLPEFREATAGKSRYIGTARVASHRIFVWQDSPVLPDSKVIAIAFDDDFHFGVLHSRIHEAWTLATCAWHGIGNDATYNPTECFETFPFPTPTPAQCDAIGAVTKELNELRESWLNPPEWTAKRTLEFPASADGPWARYLDQTTVNLLTGVGRVSYPRVEPRDAECAAKLAKRTLTNLYNERPAWLANAHAKLDAAVAAAYGWQDIALAWREAEHGALYDFKTKSSAQLSATPEQFAEAIAANAREIDNEILSRLLALNLSRAAEEAKATGTKRPRATRQKAADEML
jgi:hypothetical protein